jgi:butyrate kinase
MKKKHSDPVNVDICTKYAKFKSLHTIATKTIYYYLNNTNFKKTLEKFYEEDKVNAQNYILHFYGSKEDDFGYIEAYI